MKALVDELAAIGRAIEEQDLIILILGGLNPYFNPCVCSINRRDVSLDEAKSQLLAYENLLIQQDKNKDNHVYQANYRESDIGTKSSQSNTYSSFGSISNLGNSNRGRGGGRNCGRCKGDRPNA